MPKYKPLYSLYKGLKESKYDVPDSYISFQKTLTQAGDAGAKSRRGLYQSLKDSNYDVPDTYEDFYKNLFVPVNSTTSRDLKIGENPNTPTVNRYRQKMFDSVDPNKNGLNALSHRAVGQAVRATNNVRKPVVAKVVNRNGKPTGEEFAITPAKTVEDLDREYAQAVSKNWENELHDQMADADKDAAKISDMFKSFIGSTDEVGSVWGNITRGGGIAGTPHSVTTNNGILENTEARQILAAGDYNRKRRELLQLEQDSRLSKDTSLLGGVKKAYNDIKNGEFSKAGKDLVYGAGFDNHSFFRGMYDAAKDTGFLTGGVSDLINAGSLLATKQDLDNGIHTEAGDMLMQQAVKNSNAQSQYGDNQGWMYTGGVITTNMAPFMVQIASAGFSKGMSTSIGKVVQGAASKVALGTMEKATGIAGAHIANYIGKVTGLTTKAFGKAIQYGIVGAAQANTVGLGNVANDVINRYTGQVYQDEQGNYKFGTFDSDGKLVHEGGEDFLTALVKGETAQTIEFATELAGGGIDAVGTALKNFVKKGGKEIIKKYNMKNVSKVIDFLLNNKVSKNARYLKAGADRTLGKVEVNSIVGESLEEELGIIANTVFTGDNKISDLWDEKQQSQIWGGMLLSIGLMKGAVAPFHAYNAKQYYSYKHKLDKADVNLSQLLGKEKWEELRNQIDATTNDDMPEMVNKINRDVALGKNRQPVREYIQNLLIMRGYDIGNMLAAKKAVEDKGEGVSVKNMEKNQAYQQGRDAYGYDTHEIQLDQEDKQKSLAQLLGISEQQLASMSDEELEALSGRDDNIDRAIYDYQLSTARYEGVIDNARDQIDLEVQRAAQAVDMYTDKSRNTIRNATIKATGGLEDYGVYIINGNIATHEDGSIDISNSDDMILYYDPTTNTVEHADAMMFAELGSEENADEVRSQAMADAKEKAIKETTGIIDGVVEVGTQFKTVDADGTEHTYEVLADNGDGTAMITIDGNIPTELVKGENVNVPVSFEELQKMKDESDQQRLQAAKAQREQMEKERAEQQMQAQTTQAENPAQEDNIQSAPIEDNLDYSDIIRKDGKVQMVDVSDKDGNNLFPDAKDVFYIQGNKMRTKFAYIDANGELKTQSFPTGLVKIKTRGEVSVDDYKKYRNMILSAESSAMPETSMIEDNSGSIEADRGGIEVEDNEEGKLLNRNDDGAQTEQNQPSASVTTSQEDAAGSSESKDTNISANGNENNESLTFEDGTPIPVDANGEVDLSQTDASHAAEWYDNNLGEDADDWLDGEIKKDKKVLEQAKNMKLTGTKPSELVASKKEKEAAIADAQAHYDSAISIRDSLKERRIAKEENTSDGRRNLIEKARRKFARLKSAVKDDAEAVSQIYKETVGTLLHRLYDGTGIDVTDTIPLTAEEYVASNLGAHSLNYEGTETSKGVRQETGLSREDFAKTQLLAADGKGTTIDNLVHSLWENRPSNLDSLDTQDIRNAMLSVITSGFKASETKNYIENLRIAQAENFLEEQKKAADNAAFAEENKAESEQQTETAPESEEKTGGENSDEYNDEENEKINEQTNENINAPEQNKFPDKLREGSKAIEVPEDATDENPLGLQLSEDKVPFEIEGGKSGETYNINDNEDRQRLINDNKVDDKDILDIDMPKHVHKAIKELCKKMGLNVQFLYMGARSNGWIENGTMYLALDTEKATQFVFGHEMTHAIKQKNPEAYKELVKVAMAVTTRKKFEEDLVKVYQNYYGISGYNNIDDYVEEVVADNLGKFINDFDLAQKFSLRLNHPVLATILHAIQKIKSLLYGDFYKSVDALERIVEKAYVDTTNGQVTNSETGEDVSFSLRQKPEPKKKGIGYKVFVLKDGKLYPPMVANPNGAATPVGVWLDADAAPIAGESKTGRPQVKQGGKGTQGGSGKLAYRPGWHLGVVPYAIQFNRKDAEGNKTLFPKNFVFAEVEYAADVDYQEEARQEGINPSGKYQHSLAGLKHLPTDGYYMYRTNPNPETDPWVITGAMKVNRILTRAEQAELVKNAGREPQQIQKGDIVTDDVVNSINQEIADAPKFSLKVYHGSGADFTEFDFDHMGEGAGSQVFGWGGYVTSSKKIGKDYAAVGQQSAESRHAYSEDTPIEAAVSAILGQDIYNNQAKTFEQKKAQAIKNAENSIVNFSNMLNNSNELDEKSKKFLKESIEKDKKKLEVLRALTEEQYKEEYIKQGRAKNLYEVDIPDDNGRNYLKWYETLSEEQINTIRDALAKKGVDVSSWEKRGFKLDLPFKDVYAAVLPMMMRCEPKEVSKFLSSIGYTGIKYPAGTIMGGAEEDDTNYVIFKPEDMKITEHTKFSLKDIKPVGKNQFGDVYDQFKGKPKEAFDFLLKNKDGYLKGVFHRAEIGDIDLAYGSAPNPYKGKGLAHIIRKHVETLHDFPSVDDAINTITDVISNGVVKDGSIPNTYDIENGDYRVVVAADKNGNWVLTAFDYVNPTKKKKKGTATALPPSQSSDGAGAVAPNLSAAKIDNSSETTKENGEKFSLKDEKIKSVAEKFGVNEDDVAMYANAVERGSTADAARARANIKRYLLQANEDKISSFKELMKYTVPVNEALKENFGDLDAMIEERRKQVEAERNAMESARKRAQEEEEKRQKHLDELSLIPTDELDKRYMDAIANNDESTAREMLDESARRKGYGDADSDYQGQGAWAAPSNPQYESDEARRADIENSPDVNLEDIALGYNLQPDDYFDNPRAYMNNTAHGLESAHVIKNALDAIKNGEKDVKVKVYRAVPTSVKEGKLRNGDWVTPSKKYAEMHGDNRLEGKYRIIEDEVSANQLWWDGNDANEFGFDDGKEYRYKNAKNNRKLNDLITYDNKGNVIPPSKRFNSRKNDIRFSLAGERGAVAADKAEERTFRMDNLSVARKDQILLGVGDVSFSLRDMADGKESGAADMAEDLKSLNTPDEVDDAIKTAIDDMPSGWKMANKKMIHVAQALGENRKAEIAGEEPKFSLKDGTLIKAGTYFSGGGLVEEGLKGIIDPVVAVEYDEKISGVYRNNFGQHIVTADVRDVDPRELVKQIDGEVEYFHASPVCKNYSQAKSNHAEVELDKETAASTAEFINAIKPKVVTIENVKGYKDSDAMKTITDALDANGYTWDADVYNAADYGGYTNRERLIVRAVRDGKLPEKPKKMAHKSGWYEAVADIIPTLTEKKNGVAPWMDIRLKADGIDWRNIDKPLYVMGSAYADGKIPHAFADELLPTLRTKSGDVIVMPDGKVYRAMARVLARVSGVSDDYKMPFSENLSHTIIGNGIPTQLTEHVIAPLLTGSDPKFSIRTYHGTGASFDKFDFSHMGEGEGSQAFGWGGYVTNSKEIAEDYTRRAKIRKDNGGFEFVTDMSANNKDMVRQYIYKHKDVNKGLDAIRKDLSSALEMFPDDDDLKELSNILAKKNEEIAVPDNIAYLYDVDIPDDNGDYLDWDAPLTDKQKNTIIKELRRLKIDFADFKKRGFSFDGSFGGNAYDFLMYALRKTKKWKDVNASRAVSKFLSSIGFTGIKYKAGTIFGGAKEDDYNYVIFDENNANIVGNTRFSLRGSTPYDKQMEEWMEKNNLEKGAVPMEKPIMKEGENIFDYANRMVEWTRNQNLWKTAPKQTGFQDALDKWKADNGLSPDAYPPVRPHREYYSSEIGYAEDLEEYNKKKELWKSAPKPKDFDLSVDLEDMNKQLRNIRRAVLNQKNYDQRTVKAVSDLVRKMLNIGWGDGLSRGKVGNLLSAAKNATGANDVKKYLDKAMGILAENYLNRLSTAYDNLINTKGARADQSGVIKMGSLDAKGQAFMSEYKKAINMDDKSLNNYIANIEEDSAKNEDNVEMNDYRLAGIQAAIMYKQQIGGNDADIAELKKQIGELKNKKDTTKEDKDLLKSLEKKLFENKFDRITMYENLLNNIQRMVKESKGRAKEFREEITEHKNEILHRANLDLEGVDSTYYDTTTAKKKLVNNDLQRAVFSSTYTFEQFLKFFGKKAANGEGYLYNYFTKLNQDALDEEQLYNEMNRNALDEKTKELFGKEKFMKLVGIDGKGMKEMDVEVTDYSNKETGKRTIHLKQGQMLYIYLVNKETDGEMKLRAMGITEEDVAAIEENLDPRVKAMGEWLQDEYLPECQRRYQATHTKYFGAPMKDVENYFPLAINNRARNVKEDVNQDSDAMSQLAGTSTGAIVTRRVNVIPLDIENADAFEVAFNHLQEMEEWSAMLPFRQDINTLLSYTHFRNQVQNITSVAYGSGKTLWNEFKQTAQIAAGTYKPKVNAGMMDSRIAAAMGGIAVAKISGRLWTAIKQSQSATVFLPECDFTRFVKNGVNPYGSWKWAKENIPDFRKRIENITYGDVKLRQYLDELEKYHDWTKVISKWGMAPNILVDGITCAVGARSVYETEVNRLTKLGYPKEKAEEKAYYKAVAAYNKTQQSSGGMYLSPMQVDRTYVSAALSLFKNANYAYGRMQIEACRGLARTYDFWGGKHKTTLIESMTRQIMEEDGLDENTARAIAKATYNRTFRQSIGRLINFATLVPVSWALYKVLPYLLTGDDDDKKKDMIEEAVLKGFATSLSDNYVIPFASNILNAGLKVEDGKPTFDPEVFRYQNLYINPATSDLANIYSMVGNQKWYSVANKLGMLGVQSLIGFNPETVGALYQALSEADYDNGNTAKEWQIGILKAISAPEESIRELYMDELGLKSGDIKKIPLAELEKRYAERQINRDNLLSQIGMDAETFNGYVDKYQKSFEKKIKDKMDKWDEYDKKKADEFFDTTSDHKLKDMIEKKRTKDANAAADEQIAKEGLNQEKKGKEPSEEAYDAVKMSIDVAEDNAISTYNKVLYKRYAALNDEYNNQTDAMKYIFMNKHPNFKAYKDLESEYTTYGKKMKELKEKLVSADGYDAKQTILKQIRAEREKFSELQSKVR
jgi:site-specific DNA-cytosine methylase